MKVRVTYVYEVDLGEDSEYDENVSACAETYRDEGFDMYKDVVGPVEHTVADWLVLESHVGNDGGSVKVTDIRYETLDD